MPLTLSDAFLEQKNKLQQKDPWIWLIELDLGTEWFRKTNHVEAITFSTIDPDTGLYVSRTFNPWGFVVGDIKLSSSGETQTTSVTVGNAGRYLSAFLRVVSGQFIGVVNRPGNLYKLNKFKLDDPSTSSIPYKFKVVAQSEPDLQTVSLLLGLGVDLAQIEGPLGDYEMATHPHIPYGPPRVSTGLI